MQNSSDGVEDGVELTEGDFAATEYVCFGIEALPSTSESHDESDIKQCLLGEIIALSRINKRL